MSEKSHLMEILPTILISQQSGYHLPIIAANEQLVFNYIIIIFTYDSPVYAVHGISNGNREKL